MGLPDNIEGGERIFAGKEICVSAPIRGVPHPNPQLIGDLIGFMELNGAIVFNSYISISNEEERNREFLLRNGIRREEMDPVEAFRAIREAELRSVDDAKYLVAFVDTPTAGGTTLLHEALRKHKMGLPLTPVLCLYHVDNYENLSTMIKGIGPKDSKVAFLKGYKDLEEAKEIIAWFLTSN